MFNCIGQEKECVSIGNYPKVENAIVCTFDEILYYESSEMSDSILNKPRMKKANKAWKLYISPTACRSFPFTFHEDSVNYVLRKPQNEFGRNLRDELKKLPLTKSCF